MVQLGGPSLYATSFKTFRDFLPPTVADNRENLMCQMDCISPRGSWQKWAPFTASCHSSMKECIQVL